VAGRVKCNIDVSFSVSSSRVSIGICVRDEHEAFILAKTGWFFPKSDVLVGIGLLASLIGWMSLT
jgi:hypothetical protein